MDTMREKQKWLTQGMKKSLEHVKNGKHWLHGNESKIKRKNK